MITRVVFYLGADHGGNAVKGGGHPANSPVRAQEAIDDALGYATMGHGKAAGTADPGVGGSRTNPTDHARIAAIAHRLWEEEGRPDGWADEHWRRAEEELMAEEEEARARG